MKKKFNINRPRNINNNFRTSHHNFNHYNINYNLRIGDDSTSTNNIDNTAMFNHERNYELPKNANITIKFPLPIKITITAFIIGIIFVFLMIYIVIFGNNNSKGGYIAVAGQCPTVTVINTDCDSNGKNCSNKYDGEVEFEDYVAGVVAAEVGGRPNNLEYYKIIAISARTYFYSHIDNSCKVEGNASYQAYMDVENSSNSKKIKQAVNETRGQVIVKDEKLSESYYSSACVVNEANNNYYIRYGSKTLEEKQLQEIPKIWDNTESAFPYALANWYNLTDKNNTDLYNKECPNNHDYGMSQIGALYLVTKKNYSYDQVLKFYYGEEIEIKNVNIATSQSIEGFITPVNNATCTSNFGCRFHPVDNVYKYHQGLDLGIGSGTPIYAPKDGKIIGTVKNVPGKSTTNACGNSVHIDHGDGTRTRYCHILYNSIPDNIEQGASVRQGEVIGAVGATGSVTGPHLHYEVYVNGALVNPADYIDLANVKNGNACHGASVSDSYCGR